MRLIRFPGKVIIGSGVLKDFYHHAACFGKRFVFIGGKRALTASKEILSKGAAQSGCSAEFAEVGHVSSESEMNRVAALESVRNADALCALGGGSCMDISRSVAFELGKTIIMVPTTASSDASATHVSLVYAEDGNSIIRVNEHEKCPDMILIDSRLIAEAPPRLLASGMGDAMATWYEGIACLKHPEAGRIITRAALKLAEGCREILEESAAAAYASVCRHVVTPQLEDVIEANCILSSIGGLNTGCAGAHGLGDWLVTVPGGHDYMHGERVFVGLVVQLVLEKYPMAEIRKILCFGRSVGLPLAIGDLFGTEAVEEIARKAGAELQGDHFMRNLTCDLSPDALTGAIVLAQELSRETLCIPHTRS